jgi:hypothetical protein
MAGRAAGAATAGLVIQGVREEEEAAAARAASDTRQLLTEHRGHRDRTDFQGDSHLNG